MALGKEDRLDNILNHNERFVFHKKYEKYTATKNPNKKIVILSCMDTRLTELLPKAMNIKNGDAKIIKNAGATITHPFGSVIRSLLLAVYEFNTEDIIVVGHYDCGMTNLDGDYIVKQMLKRGIEEKTMTILNNSLVDIGKWLEGFSCAEEMLMATVNSILNHPLFPTDINIHGLLMHPHTGALDLIVNGYE